MLPLLVALAAHSLPVPPRKSRSIVDIDPPKKVVAVNDAPEDVRANAHAAWHRLRQRTSIIATLRRKRA